MINYFKYCIGNNLLMDTQFSEANNQSYYINIGSKTLMEVNFSKVQTYLLHKDKIKQTPAISMW